MVDFLHRCLELHPETTKARYGKVQRLDLVERDVRRTLDAAGDLWQAIVTIARSKVFDADMFGVLPDIERALKEQDWYAEWQALPKHRLIAKLYGVYRQIEPASMVLRFTMPDRYGIFSAPVASLLGVRHSRRQKDTYNAYLKSLNELRHQRGFLRIADVEMALWVLQVGVIEGALPAGGERDALARKHRRDKALWRMQAHNATAQLFSEWRKLKLAAALCEDRPALAGQIAGIEFEQLVGKWVPHCDGSLKDAIEASAAPHDKKQRLHRARRIRNRAIHRPRKATRKDSRELIDMAEWVEHQLRQRSPR